MAREGNAPAVESFLPLEEVARRLGYKCIRSVKRQIDRGFLPKPVVVGGRQCIVEAELQRRVLEWKQYRDRDLKLMREKKRHALPDMMVATDEEMQP
jgi:hypothetical protein